MFAYLFSRLDKVSLGQNIVSARTSLLTGITQTGSAVCNLSGRLDQLLLLIWRGMATTEKDRPELMARLLQRVRSIDELSQINNLGPASL